MNGEGSISGFLVTHKTAGMDELEEVCKPDSSEVLDRLVSYEGVEEAYVLQTCNRGEFYASGERSDEALDELAEDLDIRTGIAKRTGRSESVRHLMRIACGLKSMVIGEDEILGQVREAYHTASDRGALEGGELDKAVMKSLHLGERARTETRINEGNASMGSAAVEIAREHLGNLAGLKVVVVGVGDMGELVAKSLVNRDREYEDILVANRTYERAERLADEIGGSPIKFGEVDHHLRTADVVVTATSAPHLIFDRSDLEGHDLLVLDLANPRDVASEAQELDGVDVIDIDDLSEVNDSSLETRKEAAEQVESMIDEEMEVLESQYKREKATEMLSTIYSRAEEIRREETREALERIESRSDDGVSEEVEEVVDDMTQSLVNTLL
ncbi:MAG: glutamyl-tRNA reductase, partial [Halobacteria archaeon]|nr:glutamyl-tRNA reductase [Halobacteria archaeon]